MQYRHDLKITDRPISELKPRAANPRTHSKKQLEQIADSIRRFGFTNPVLIDTNNAIIAGHGRVEAAKLIGMETVPTICLSDMTETEIRAYVIADNRLAENAGWDEELLAIELQYLSDLDLDFDVSVIGFEVAEIDLLIGGLEPNDNDPAADEIPELDPEAPPVSRPGDLWRLGAHRLLCGDATEPKAFEHLMAGKKAQMVFVDPPYNVPIDGHVCGSGAIKHSDFAMASGEMSEKQFTDFLEGVFADLAAYSADGSIHFVCMDWRHLPEILGAGRAAYSELKNLCVWNKSNAGMGSLYRSKHELVLVFKNGRTAHINNVELGRHGRNRTNVWDYPGVNTLRSGRLDELRMHPTVKPVALVADAIKDTSRRRGIVLDCFAGSGTTIIAAEKTGRRAYTIELEPKFVDTAIRRWQDYVGELAVQAETDLTFAAMAERRSASSDGDHGDKQTGGAPTRRPRREEANHAR